MSESEGIILNLPNNLLEKLRCSICKGYLSCSPVCLSQDGSYICGNCSPLNLDMPVYRVSLLEEILSKTSFPCQFKEHGCTENVLFGGVADHQNKCAYRSLLCPSLTTCSWKGLVSEFFEHFTENHADFIQDKAEFNLNLDQNAEGVLMTVEDSFIFIVKYIYSASENTLKYDIRFCTNKIGYDVSFKSRLINASDIDCLVSLKMSKCSLYDEGFYEMQGPKTLNINKFLDNLGDPNSIIIALKPKIVKSFNYNAQIANNLEVNFDLIKSLKCHGCKNYLVPPLFDLNGKAVCCDCATDSSCTPTKNLNLLKLVNEAVYPCRWRDCNFVATSKDFKGHEKACQFRHYSCMSPACENTFKLPELINHLQDNHEIQHFDKTVYKTSFAKNYDYRFVFTITESVPILIQHEMINSQSPCIYLVKVFSSSGDSVKITCVLDFEHEHCKLKSQEFVVRKERLLKITLQELPPCFKEKDELTVNVKLNIE